MIPPDAIRQVKAAADIGAVMMDYGLKLRRVSSNRYTGLCFKHPDKNPSLSVRTDWAKYKCWSCGAHGDVIDFVAAMENISTGEAVRKLAERYSVPLATMTAAERRRYREQRRRAEALAREAEQFGVGMRIALERRLTAAKDLLQVMIETDDDVLIDSLGAQVHLLTSALSVARGSDPDALVRWYTAARREHPAAARRARELGRKHIAAVEKDTRKIITMIASTMPTAEAA